MHKHNTYSWVRLVEKKSMKAKQLKQLKKILIVNKWMKSKKLKNSQLGMAAVAWERSGKERTKILVWHLSKKKFFIDTAGWE